MFGSVRISFDYKDSTGVVKNKKVSILEHFYGTVSDNKKKDWYLLAFDIEVKSDRIFKLSNMSNIEPLKHSFVDRKEIHHNETFEVMMDFVANYDIKEKIQIFSEKEALIYFKKHKAEIKFLKRLKRNSVDEYEHYVQVWTGLKKIYAFDLIEAANYCEDLAHNPPATYEKLNWWDLQMYFTF